MDILLKKFKKISLYDVVKIEESDSQYKSLKNLYFNLKNKDFYLSLIIANSVICYQLSSKGEFYWEEFSNYFSKNIINSKSEITKKIGEFIIESKGNKRFLKTKINRLEKLNFFLNDFIGNEKMYYENMNLLLEKLSQVMDQKKTDKTIVFSIKMFGYGARNYFNKLIMFPFSISIPIDSRLKKLFKIYNTDSNLKIENFYYILSKKLNIPPLHLDAILWVNYNIIISNY